MAIDTSIPEMENLSDEYDKESNEIEIEETSNDTEKRMRAKNTFGDQKYKYYTKEFDEIIVAEDLETEEELFRLRQNLDQYPINLPPNNTIFWGIIRVGRNIIEIKMIPEKKNNENKKFLNI